MSGDAGINWAIAIMREAFAALALDFAAVDRESAFAALSRIELSVADELATFREQYPEGFDAELVDPTLAAVLDQMGLFIEHTRDAMKSGRSKPE